MISIIVPQQLALAKIARGTTFNDCMLAGLGVATATELSTIIFNHFMEDCND